MIKIFGTVLVWVGMFVLITTWTSLVFGYGPPARADVAFTWMDSAMGIALGHIIAGGILRNTQ